MDDAANQARAERELQRVQRTDHAEALRKELNAAGDALRDVVRYASERRFGRAVIHAQGALVSVGRIIVLCCEGERLDA